jgi:Fur family transcriptional regulator, ferric uptake regulator
VSAEGVAIDGGQAPAEPAPPGGAWSDVRDQLRARGLRWTPQRRLILDVLGATQGHVTGSEIVERCRAKDPETTPSTVYRTLDVLEELGYLHHSHGADGREEFHVLPHAEHAHLRCDRCNGSWEITPDEATALVDGLERSRGFRVHLGHLTVTGVCAECATSTGSSETSD